jgi:hypothetical protein
MNADARDAVLEVITQLVTELGVDNVPDDCDLDGAIKLLTEDPYAPQEALADAEVEAFFKALDAVPEA